MARKDDKIEELIKSGEAKIAEGDFEGAIKDHDKAINLNPADKSQLAEVYNDRGFAKNRLGHHEDAIADCAKATDLNPELESAWNSLGFAKNALNRHKEAIADLDEAIALKPADKEVLSSAYNNRGLAKAHLGYHDEAITDYTEVIRLDPENARAWNNRGLAKGWLDRLEEAIADFDEAIRIDPELAFAWDNRGLAKGRLGRLEEAIADHDETIRIDPDYARAWNNRGVAKTNLGRYEEAIADYTEAIRLDPENAAARNNLAAIKAEKAARDVVEERVGSLADTKELEEQAKKYEREEKMNRRFASRVINRLRKTIFCLVIVLVVFVVLRSVFCFTLESTCVTLNPFSLLPWITLIIIIISPLVWTIRLRTAEANSAKIMHAEYMHLALVEKRMFFYFAKDDTDEGKKIRADYIKTTMTNSPSDKLVALQSKTSAPSPNPAQNIVENIVNKVRSNPPS